MIALLQDVGPNELTRERCEKAVDDFLAASPPGWDS